MEPRSKGSECPPPHTHTREYSTVLTLIGKFGKARNTPDAMLRDATHFYRRPRRLPMVFNVSEHSRRDALRDATRQNLGKPRGAFYRVRHTVAF